MNRHQWIHSRVDSSVRLSQTLDCQSVWERFIYKHNSHKLCGKSTLWTHEKIQHNKCDDASHYNPYIPQITHRFIFQRPEFPLQEEMIPAGHTNNPTTYVKEFSVYIKQLINHIHTENTAGIPWQRSGQASAYSRSIWDQDSPAKQTAPNKLSNSNGTHGLWKGCGNDFNTSLTSTGGKWRCNCYITWFMSWIIRLGKVLRTPLLSLSLRQWLLPPSARVHWASTTSTPKYVYYQGASLTLRPNVHTIHPTCPKQYWKWLISHRI